MRTVLSACALLLALGCSDPTGPAGRVEGTWTLQSINGYTIPYSSPQGNGDSIELTSDVIIANSANAFTQMTVVTTTEGGVVTVDSIPDAGTYSISGSKVTFTFDSGSPPGTGTVDRDYMVVPFNDVTLIYKR